MCGVTGFVRAYSVYNLSSFSYGWYDVTGFVPTDGVYNLSTFICDCTTSLVLCQQVVCMPVDLQATSSVFVPADGLCVFLQAVEIVCLYGLFFQISCPGNRWYIVFSFVSAGDVGGVYYTRLFSRRSVASSLSCLKAMSQASLNTSDLLNRTPLVRVGLFASLSARLSTLCWFVCSPVCLLGYRQCPQHVQDS